VPTIYTNFVAALARSELAIRRVERLHAQRTLLLLLLQLVGGGGVGVAVVGFVVVVVVLVVIGVLIAV